MLATEKLLEPKRVRTRGTDNRLVSDERNVRDEMQRLLIYMSPSFQFLKDLGANSKIDLVTLDLARSRRRSRLSRLRDMRHSREGFDIR